MKEQWCISKEALVALEEGTPKDGIVAGTSNQKKSTNVTAHFFRFVKLVLLVQAFLFAGWFSSSLWQYYRSQSMQVKATGYVPETHGSFHLQSMENNDDPSMEFVVRTESLKQRLDDANALEIRNALIEQESSTYGSTPLANGHPIVSETTQSPDSEIKREEHDAIVDTVDDEDDEVEVVVTSVDSTTASSTEKTTVLFPAETDAQESLEKINLQDPEIEQTRPDREENVEWGFPFAWSIHGLQGDQTSRGSQEEEFQSRFVGKEESKEIGGSNVDEQSADGIVTSVESKEDGRSNDETSGEKVVRFVELGKAGRSDVDEEFEGKVVTSESEETRKLDVDEESREKSMTSEASEENGRSDDGRGSSLVDDKFDRYEGTRTPDESTEYAQRDSPFQEESTAVVRSEEYVTTSENDEHATSSVTSNVDDSWTDYEDLGMDDYSDREILRDMNFGDYEIPIGLEDILFDFDLGDIEDNPEKLRRFKMMLLRRIIREKKKHGLTYPIRYDLDYLNLFNLAILDDDLEYTRCFRSVRSINSDSSSEVSGNTRNALTEGVKPGALLRQGILGRRAEIAERMQQVQDYDQELLQQNLDKFFNRMEILAAHIDRLHERYHHLNELNDDYVSNEFPSESLER